MGSVSAPSRSRRLALMRRVNRQCKGHARRGLMRACAMLPVLWRARASVRRVRLEHLPKSSQVLRSHHPLLLA